MQRMLVIFAVILLVTASLGVGALAAHWPFWRRAWAWHTAPGAYPDSLPGPSVTIRGAAAPVPLTLVPEPAFASVAATGRSHALLLAGPGEPVRAWFAPGWSLETAVDGRGLTTALLPALYGVLARHDAGLLDAPVGGVIEAWGEDRRGPITPRQLLWQLSGLPARAGSALNPFGVRAQLASGPDFNRAALRWRATYPPGTHFEESPVNAQLLALVAALTLDTSYAGLLERELWSRFAAGDAELLLDHRRGAAAAHCCMVAPLGDWLRLGTVLAGHPGAAGPLLPADFRQQLAQASPVHADYGLGFRLERSASAGAVLVLQSEGRLLRIDQGSGSVLLWVGEGDPPAGLDALQ